AVADRRVERGNLLPVPDVDAERMGAAAQDLEQGRARAAAEPVAADAVDSAAEVDLDVVPVGEVAHDRPVGLAVVALERGQRLVGEHHAEAERVVRPVALEHGDARRRPGLLQQDREIEAGRSAAGDVNFHGAPPATARPCESPAENTLSLKY